MFLLKQKLKQGLFQDSFNIYIYDRIYIYICLIYY